MKKTNVFFISIFLISSFLENHLAFAQTIKVQSAKTQTTKVSSKAISKTNAKTSSRQKSKKNQTSNNKKNSNQDDGASPAKSAISAQLSQALRLVQSGQCQQAVPLLYSMTRKSEFDRERMQIKYILGNCLIDLGLNQIAAFELVEVIKNGSSRYVKQAIEKLSIAADALGDDTLLNYAVSKIKIEDIPENGKDLIYYRLGEVKLKSGQYSQAIDLFNKVPDSSRYYFLSRYNKGLAYLEAKKPQEAIQLFKALAAYRSSASVTDTNRVSA